MMMLQHCVAEYNTQRRHRYAEEEESSELHAQKAVDSQVISAAEA